MMLLPPRKAYARVRLNCAGVRLVVVEEGARELDSRVPSSGDDNLEEEIVLAQSDGELPVSLMLRVGSAIGALEQAQRSLGRAVLVVGRRGGAQVSAARVLIARTLLSHMAARGTGELSIVASGVEAEVRHELMSLVEELLGEHEQCSVPIRLRIEGDPTRSTRASGIHRIAGLGHVAARLAGSGRR
jgi:hypothetical protein